MLLINADGPDVRVALLENGLLAEVYVERSADRGIVGNVYKGRVVRVLPGMQAAFVEIGLEKAAFLHASDVRPDEGDGDDELEVVDEAAPDAGQATEAPLRTPIQELVHEGQQILVQVAKAPIGTKGARVTGYVSLPGRQLVLMPGVNHVGVSRRIASEVERKRLRETVERMRPPGHGFIARTVAEGQSEEKLRADMEYLLKVWSDIQARDATAAAPALLYSDLDLMLRVVRDLCSSENDRVIIDDLEAHARVQQFLAAFMPRYQRVLELYQGAEPLFDAYGVELEVDRAMERKVWLKSGGYLVIDQGEALTSIDVNTGRYVGRRNVEDTITKTNLEAVREVVAQLRLRNIGGIIIVDFIDMERETDRQKVWRALQTALRADRVKSHVLEISSLGLVEMTRKRVRESLNQQLTESCPYCEGRGFVKSTTTVCYEVLRELRRQAPALGGRTILLWVHPEVASALADTEAAHLARLERRFGVRAVVESRANFHVEQFEINVR